MRAISGHYQRRDREHSHVGEPRGGGSRRAYASLDLDWRLLLPAPSADKYERLLVLGADEAMAEELEAAGIARDVAFRPDGRRADIVACLRGAGLSLVQAVEHVGSGGTLYYESSGGASREAEHFSGAPVEVAPRRDLSADRDLRVRPGFSGPRTYFPLDVPRALRSYSRICTGRAHGSRPSNAGSSWLCG